MEKENIKRLLRLDRRAKVSFSLVAVLILMLSTVSVIYISYIDRIERERKQEEGITTNMKYNVNLAQAEIESKAYILAMDAIYQATQEENDQNRIIPIFEKSFESYMEKYTDDVGKDKGDYIIKVTNYTTSLSLDSKLTYDLISANPKKGITDGQRLEKISINKTHEINATPTNAYYDLEGDISYKVEHKDSKVELEKNMSFSRTIKTPYPVLNNKFEEFNTAAKTRTSSLGRMVEYILVTLAQYRVIQGYGAIDIEDHEFNVGATDEILTVGDIELAMNLAILLEMTKLYRNYDTDILSGFPVSSDDVDKPMASLISKWVKEDQIDAADIIALYKGLEKEELDFSMILGQAMYALMDQFIKKYYEYFGLYSIIDVVWQGGQIVWNAIDGFFDWLGGLLPQEEEDKRTKMANMAKDWIRTQIERSKELEGGPLDRWFMNNTNVSIEEKRYDVTFDKDSTCTHMEDTDHNGSTPDEPVEYHWEVNTKYTVEIPSSIQEVNFQEMDILREEMNDLWASFYESYFTDENEDNIVRSLSDTLKEIILTVVERTGQLPGLRDIVDNYNQLPAGAVIPNDEKPFLELIRDQVGDMMDETKAYFAGDEGKEAIRLLIQDLITDHNNMQYELRDMLITSFDEFAAKDDNIEGATQQLTDALLNTAKVLPGGGNTVEVDNPQEIQNPDVPPKPEPAAPGRLPRAVPYIHQVYDTPKWFNGHWACGATSAMMAFGYYDIIPAHLRNGYISNKYTFNGHTYNIGSRDPSGHMAWGGYGFITQNNWADTKGNMARYARQHGLNSWVDWSPTWGELTAEIDAGHPVVLLTSLTGPGHYVLATGYVPNTHVVIVNDPYGNKNQGYINYNGAGVKYDWPGFHHGHSNLNIVHTLIYFKGDPPARRTRGEVTPDEWRVMYCAYGHPPEGHPDSLPKYSESKILNRFKLVKRAEVEAYARKLVEEAYEVVKDEEIEDLKVAIDAIAERTGNEILDLFIDGIATLGHASGFFPVVCEFAKSVATEIIYSTEIKNTNYFLPLRMGVPFKFWSDETNYRTRKVDMKAAMRKGKVSFESIKVNMEPNYLTVDNGDLSIQKSQPEGIHYTNLTEFHSKPFETTWRINITGSFNLTTWSESKELEFNGRHLSVGKKGEVEIEISTPITVYSGWELENVDYKKTKTLWGDIAGYVLEFLAKVWKGLTVVVGWLIDGLMKVLTVLINIIHAIVNFASEVIKVIVDVFTWIIEKVRKFIQETLDIVAKALLGVMYVLGNGFNFTAFGIDFNVTTKFDKNDIPGEGWDWLGRISARANLKSFAFGFDLSVVRKNGTDDYDILINSGLKIGDFILEVAVDPLMAVWPRFIEGHGIYLNKTGQGFGIDFTSPEVTKGWSALGSIDFNKNYIKKVIKIPTSRLMIPYLGSVQAKLGVKLWGWSKWGDKGKFDAKEVYSKVNETFYEVWHGLGGKLPMDGDMINNYSEQLMLSFKKNLGPVVEDLGSDIKLKVWLQLDVKPFGGRFKLGGLSGYTVWRTKLEFVTDFGQDLKKNVNFIGSYTKQYMEDPGQEVEGEEETGITTKFSTMAKVHLKKRFESPIDIPLLGIDAKGEVGAGISVKYTYREELTQAWEGMKQELEADWDAATAGESMDLLMNKAKGLVSYLSENVEFKTWMKLHLSKKLGGFGKLGSTINVDFTVVGVENVTKGCNWIKTNIDKYILHPGRNVTVSEIPEVKIRFYVTAELSLKHKIAKIPVPAIGCTADITIGFKFSLKFKETTNLTSFITYMNTSFDEVDNETDNSSAAKDESFITVYSQKIMKKFKDAIDYVLDNGRMSFYIRFDLDVGGLDSLQAGVILKFMMRCELRGLWEVIKWVMGNVGAFVNNVLNPANAAKYPDVPKKYLEKIHIAFEAFVQAGPPELIADLTKSIDDKTGVDIDMKIRLSFVINTNLPMIGAAFGQDWGRYRARFGLVLKLDLRAKYGLNLFDKMNVEIHPHAWYRLWFFRGKVYEIE